MLIKIYKEWSILNTVKISFCKVAVSLIKFAIKDETMTPKKKKKKKKKTSKKKNEFLPIYKANLSLCWIC